MKNKMHRSHLMLYKSQRCTWKCQKIIYFRTVFFFEVIVWVLKYTYSLNSVLDTQIDTYTLNQMKYILWIAFQNINTCSRVILNWRKTFVVSRRVVYFKWKKKGQTKFKLLLVLSDVKFVYKYIHCMVYKADWLNALKMTILLD